MAATGSPTARRRELGSMLRSLRKSKGLTAEQVGERLGFSPSKVSRLENGRRGASRGDIARLCDLYQVDEEYRSQLTELAVEGKQRVWWQSLSQPYADYVGLEQEADFISDYGLALVPGLLQTPDYARAIVRTSGGPTLASKVVDDVVQARMVRQRVLFSDKAPVLTAVLDESVLHRVVGDSAVMLAQLKQLMEMSQLPNVTMRVVPYDAGVVPTGVQKFVILGSREPRITDIVYLEELTDHRYLEDPGAVDAYKATFRTLLALSADPAASRAMVLAKLTAYESRNR